MSDPLTHMLESQIRDELNRQNDAKEESIDILEVDVSALARAVGRLVPQDRGLLEPGAPTWEHLTSSSISLKRIADALAGTPEAGTFLQQLFHTLNDVSHNHAQRMGR